MGSARNACCAGEPVSMSARMYPAEWDAYQKEFKWPDCAGCDRRGEWVFLCSYHEGWDDAIWEMRPDFAKEIVKQTQKTVDVTKGRNLSAISKHHSARR